MGPLSGTKIIEIAGIGPGPFCGMMLSDMGAEVLRVNRVTAKPSRILPPEKDILARGRRVITVDLRRPEGVDLVLRLCQKADAIFEGFRPGVAEKIGIGPEACLARNPKIVYGRMTGWGQDGPLSKAAGHDINYISLSGALHAIGRKGERPVPPLNLIGDFGGGGMFLAFGIVCGLLEAQKSKQGQVVDAAMIDGSAALMAMFFSMMHVGLFKTERGTNLLDTGAHFYDVYETKDGKYVSIGSIEPQFYAELIQKAELDPQIFAEQLNISKWPDYKEKLIEIFKTKTRDEWCAVMEGSDVCFAPVLSIAEAPNHPHNQSRGTFVTVNDVLQPAPAPRFSRTPTGLRARAEKEGQDPSTILADYGFNDGEIRKLLDQGVVSGNNS
jgi:alpha-methylacyl-CoA racemase